MGGTGEGEERGQETACSKLERELEPLRSGREGSKVDVGAT